MIETNNPNITIHVTKWFELIELAKKNIPIKEMRSHLDNYAKTWSRLKYDEQGEISFRINQRYNKV